MSRPDPTRRKAATRVPPANAKSSSRSGAKVGSPAVDEIAERVLQAIWEHRLPPGTKLIEDKLAQVFAVSRTKIRLALAKLAHESVLTVFPNRGTYVSSPSVEEARAVFRARRLLEPALMREVVRTVDARALDGLRATAARERKARAENDRRSLVRLSGEFHVLLAEIDGNPFVVKAMRELCSLTCLIIALYDAPGVPACPQHEHDQLIDAIEAQDADTAAALMVEHLNHVENMLELSPPVIEEIDIEAVFAG